MPETSSICVDQWLDAPRSVAISKDNASICVPTFICWNAGESGIRFSKSLKAVEFRTDPHKQFGIVSGISDPVLRQERAGEVNPQRSIDIFGPELMTEPFAFHRFPDAADCVSFVGHLVICSESR
jgi:hypothetical protein